MMYRYKGMHDREQHMCTVVSRVRRKLRVWMQWDRLWTSNRQFMWR